MLMLGLRFSTCSAWSPTYWFLLLARTLVGFGLGGSSVRLQSNYFEWHSISIPNLFKQYKAFFLHLFIFVFLMLYLKLLVGFWN